MHNIENNDSSNRPAPDREPDGSVQEAACNWFARMRDVDVTPQERRDLAAWLAADPAHRRAYEEVEALWRELDALAPAPGLQAAAIPRSRNWYRRVSPTRWVAAAVLVLVAASACLFGTLEVSADYSTGAGERRSIELADGSSVILLPESAASVVMDRGRRQVDLHRGQAFFSVAPDADRPFDVLAANGRMRVVGTRFHVDIGSRVVVEVSSGAVDVIISDADPVRLSGGHGLVYDADGIVESGDRAGRFRERQAERLTLIRQAAMMPIRVPAADLDTALPDMGTQQAFALRHRRIRAESARPVPLLV